MTLIPPKQVEQITGLSINYLAKVRLTKTGPRYVKFGRKVMYLAEDVQAWIQANIHESTADYGK